MGEYTNHIMYRSKKQKNDRCIKLICIELSSSWLGICIIELMKNKKYHTRINCKIKIVERGKTDTPSTQIHERSLSLFNTVIYVKSGGAKLILWTQSFTYSEEKLLFSGYILLQFVISVPMPYYNLIV